MPLLLLLFAASIALMFAVTVLFNTPPKGKAQNTPRTSAKVDSDSEMKYRKTVGF
ncbi:MAG: hypothetical protein LLG02_16500 [Pelosinus sp.]|nr:hypothetical protein [Pelosinus sp.]